MATAALIQGEPAMRRTESGVTLIELMIVVVIVGILAVIAYPNYREYVDRGRRADGQGLLMNVSQRLERCFTQFNAYNNAGCTVAFPVNSSDGFYEVPDPGAARTAVSFEIRAVPQGPQANDRCGTLTLTHTGVRGIVNAASGVTADNCW